jgi:hypothetical protein
MRRARSKRHPGIVFYRRRRCGCVWNGVLTLRIEFFSGEPEVRSDVSSERIHIAVDGACVELSRADAVALKERLGEAVAADHEFFRTAGRHREDGSYEVRRRGADSTGNAKVFRDFDALERLYERLPDEFDADDVSRTGITGSRRHMLVRHVAEHPAFDCEITSRSPLHAAKTEGDAGGADDRQSGEVTVGD